jgi:hypothetical protein
MRGMSFLVAATAIGLLAAGGPSQAEITYPWCAQYGGDATGGKNCGFSTLEQCRAAASGNGGFCEQNPMYQPAQTPASRRPHR